MLKKIVILMVVIFGDSYSMDSLTSIKQVDNFISTLMSFPVSDRKAIVRQIVDATSSRAETNPDVKIAILKKIDTRLHPCMPWITGIIQPKLDQLLKLPDEEEEDVCEKHPDRLGEALLNASNITVPNSIYDLDTVLEAADILIVNCPNIFRSKMLEPMKKRGLSSYLPQGFR